MRSWAGVMALLVTAALLLGGGVAARAGEDADPPAGVATPAAAPGAPALSPAPTTEAGGAGTAVQAAGEGSPAKGGVLPASGPTERIHLEDAVRMALRGNLPLLQGSYDSMIAMEQRRVAEAAFDTLLSATFDYAHDEQPSTSAFFGKSVVSNDTLSGSATVSRSLPSGGSVSLLYRADRLDTDSLFTTLNPSWTETTSFEGTQPLLRGAGDVALADIRRASNGVRIAADSQRALVEKILLEVVSAYWELAYAQDLVVARQKSEEVAAELLHDAEARLEAKVGTPLNVAEARAGLERRRGDRIAAEGGLGTARDALRALIFPFAQRGGSAKPDGVVFVAIDDPALDRGMTPDVGQLDHYVDMALANRPDLRASQTDLRNRDLDVFVAQDGLKPQLDLVANAGTAGLKENFADGFGQMATGEAVSVGVGLRFSMYIGRRAAKANVRLAEWARRQAVLGHKELQNQVVSEVRSGLRDVLTDRALEEAAAEEVRASEEDTRGERSLLENGKSTPFRVLQKEDDLTTARTRLARSRADRRIAEARFWRALGFLADTLGLGASSPTPAAAK